jgi:hypothetical protein
VVEFRAIPFALRDSFIFLTAKIALLSPGIGNSFATMLAFLKSNQLGETKDLEGMNYDSGKQTPKQ